MNGPSITRVQPVDASALSSAPTNERLSPTVAQFTGSEVGSSDRLLWGGYCGHRPGCLRGIGTTTLAPEVSCVSSVITAESVLILLRS